MKVETVRTFARNAIGLAVVCLLFVPQAVPQKGQGAQNTDALIQKLNDQASKGELNPQNAQNALDAAGIKGDQQNQIMQGLMDKQQAFTDAQLKAQHDQAAKDQAAKDKADAAAKAAKDAKEQADQNASGTADWNFGQVYRDRDYKVTMPLENNCKVNQTVTITYPSTINLQGPPTVDVPAKSKVDVPMQLVMTQPPLPLPPWPPGVTFDCYDIKGDMKLNHPELRREWSDGNGRHEYICHEMKRTYTIKAHVHDHGPPNPPQGGGGGGKGGKGGKGGGSGGGGGGGGGRDLSTCDIYWNHREFYPNNVQHNPEQCVTEIRADAREYFGPLLAPFKARDPKAWSWTPDDAAINQMSVAQLMDLKARADAQAKTMVAAK